MLINRQWGVGFSSYVAIFPFDIWNVNERIWRGKAVGEVLLPEMSIIKLFCYNKFPEKSQFVEW